MSRLLRVAMLAPVMSAVLALFGVAPAGAAVPLPAVASGTPVSWTPNVFAGTTDSTVCTQWFGSGGCSDSGVLSTAIVNGEVVVAGAFTQACQPGPSSSGHCKPGTLVTRDDIFAYQLGTGVIDPDFAPQLDQGPVYSVTPGPDNTVYVGGAFTTVTDAAGTHTHNRGLVQLNVTPGNAATDGQVVTAFTGHVSNTVRALAYNGSALYVGGQFTTVDSTAEDGIARLNATTGAVDTTFSMTISNPVVSGLSLRVEDLSLSADAQQLAIAGTFLDVNGQSRPRVALISTGGGLGSTATLANWAAPILSNNCSSEHDYVRGIDFSPDGSFLVVSATGFKSSPTNSASICDATARFPTAPAGTSIAPTWVNYTGGDSLYSVQVTGAVVYVGGHNRWTNNECGSDEVCEANSVLSMGYAAIDANTGLTIPWYHALTLRGRGVMSLTSFPAGLFTGSNGGVLLGDNVTLNGNGAYHSFNALFPLTSTAASPAFGSIPSGIFAPGRLGGHDESTAGVAAMCVDDPGNSATPGTTVQFSTCTNGAEQNWTVQANGNVTINGLCLDTVGQGTASGTQVDVNTCGASATQVWTQGAGNTLVNSASGLCLDDPGAKTTNGTVLDVATCSGGTNQVWPLPSAPAPASLIPAGPVFASALQSSGQPACLTDNGNSTTPGTAVVMSTCYGNQQQNATIQASGNIQVRGLCMDTAGQATASGTAVVLNTCGSSATQVWTLSPANHTLVNQASGLCLAAAASTNGSALSIAACSSSSSLQQWWLPAV
jgi:Ricin-type beta-trefoil lectin domain/Domain of unknown function (DUF5122) beta-propeller